MGVSVCSFPIVLLQESPSSTSFGHELQVRNNLLPAAELGLYTLKSVG